jgi:sulfopyruvate decarboxylase subunit beta
LNATSAAAALARAVPDGLFVASLGTATSALRAATDDGPHLYLGGSMGSALAVAIGVAEKRPDRRVVAVLGDGEMLMGAGSLWTLASAQTPRLTAAILCDGHYSITGGQRLGVQPAFASVAQGLGLTTGRASSEDEVEAVMRGDAPPAVLEIHYGEREWPGPSPFVDPPLVRWRFARAAGTPTDAVA